GILGGGGGGGLGSSGGTGGFGAGGGGAVTGGLGGGGFGAAGGNGASDPSGVGGGGGGSGLGGAIFVQSGGTLTVVDAADISGNTAMAGTGGGSSNAADPNYVAAGNGIAMGQDIFVREQGALVFDLSNALNIATPIEGDQTNGPGGSGGLQKIGAGTLNLHGTNTYSGTTAVDDGTLNLNGSVMGNTAVGAAGTLSGNATVLGNLTNAGTLAPGNSIGTIHTANLSLAASSVLKMEITSAEGSDLVSAAGTAQLTGTLEIKLDSAAYQAGSYTLLTSSALTGTFGAITFAGPKPAAYSIAYLPVGAPTYVQLTLPTRPVSPVPTLNTWFLCTLLLGLLSAGAFGIRRLK
ncbi:MAG: autotransporter-associated beta strand repeat-containing protein, partial [Ottowia sp.]|uniref:autotransporter-associated beta strand repeat-containing protein n=1 Tax=Ottowia sp. TaxID=1898956 RepID=UPI003C739CFC